MLKSLNSLMGFQERDWGWGAVFNFYFLHKLLQVLVVAPRDLHAAESVVLGFQAWTSLSDSVVPCDKYLWLSGCSVQDSLNSQHTGQLCQAL